MFDVSYDEAERILHLRLTGFWTLATVAAFAATLAARIGRIRLVSRRFDVLSDARDFPVQAGLVGSAMAALQARAAAFHPGRTAIVVSGALSRIQAERVMTAPRVRVFVDMGAARSWLATAATD